MSPLHGSLAGQPLLLLLACSEGCGLHHNSSIIYLLTCTRLFIAFCSVILYIFNLLLSHDWDIKHTCSNKRTSDSM